MKGVLMIAELTEHPVFRYRIVLREVRFMCDDATAILSNDGDMTSFAFAGKTIRFRTSKNLVHYDAVTEWDNGYIECLATYDNPPVTEEDYIDLIPFLENLYFDPEEFLKGIREVKVQYA